MKTFDAALWIQAEIDTGWKRSQVQTFLYNRKSEDWKEANMTVRDCLRPDAEQVIWKKASTAETYDALSAEASRFVREYCAGIIFERYAALLRAEGE